MRDYWTWFWHPKYGNCFTFNRGSDAQNKPITVLMSSIPGQDAGTLMPPTPGSLSIFAIVFIVNCVCVSSLRIEHLELRMQVDVPQKNFWIY